MRTAAAITIENDQECIEYSPDTETLIRKTSELCLLLEGIAMPVELDILLVDDLRIREMNREHRSIDKATDVLSFPIAVMKEGKLVSSVGDFDPDTNSLILGDIVISMETAERQAREYGHPFRRELAFLVTHGMFHLLGYDHGDTESEKTMLQKQEQVLDKLGYKRTP